MPGCRLPGVRRLLLILLAALLPLQWSYAAVAELCVAQAPERAHFVVDVASGAEHVAAHSVHAHDAHGHGAHSLGREAAAHGERSHDGTGHAAAAGADVAAPDDRVAADADCLAMAHHGACCHVVAAALPAPAAVLYPMAGAASALPAPALPALSHASDGPFRPPRSVTA